MGSTAQLLSNTNFNLDLSDETASLHVCAAIASQNNLGFALMPSPSAEVMSDAWNKSADFAMENDILTESSMFLLSSNCPAHQTKAISLRLEGDLNALEADKTAKARFIEDARTKIAAVHEVNPMDVVILPLTAGSTVVPYLLPRGSGALSAIQQRYAAQFGPSYLGHQIHPSFTQLQINPATFVPSWNRDFGNPAMCPQGERRGNQPYIPPAGWRRFGMNVLGKFIDGDTWLGMSNVAGEWCIAYHGTKYHCLRDMTEGPPRAGTTNYFGYGIYCSPDPAVAAGLAKVIEVPVGTSTVRCSYMFMCRVNTRSIHRCTQSTCEFAKDPNYTLHMTTYHGIWFVNCQNQNYQNIRPYGLLVKEEP
jgi:hypothetical protein